MTKKHSQYHAAPPEEIHEGELFRVRDKDWEKVWGENLSYADAEKLKSKVVGRGKSKTARLENMKEEAPAWYVEAVASGNIPAETDVPDPQFEMARRKAAQVARQAAQVAQEKHQRHQARDRSSPGAAKQTARAAVPPRPVPVISTSEPSELGDDDGLGDGDVTDLLADSGSDSPSAEDLARAKAQAAKDQAEIEAKAKMMYDAQKREGHVPWEQLSKSVRANWCFEAANAPQQANGAAS